MLPVPNSHQYDLCGRKATLEEEHRRAKLCESRGGRPGLPALTCPYGLCGRKATLEERDRAQGLCVKVEVAVPGSPCLLVLAVSVDVKQH